MIGCYTWSVCVVNPKLPAIYRKHLIGQLPKVFIAFAFMNFLIGATLGGWMASRPAIWAEVGSIHGEINPFGWLTMLIYGMTYAVLSISAGIRPPKAWVGWLHLSLSELAVLLVSAAYLAHRIFLLQIGLACQFAAPLIFLVNILSAVISSRRGEKNTNDKEIDGETDEYRALGFLRRSSFHQATDRVAQRGTDIALILFLIGAGWMMLSSFGMQGTSLDMPQNGALFLIYYGWIAGTIFAVSLHLFPRFVDSKFNVRAVTFGQVIWGISLVLGTLESVWLPSKQNIGYRLFGVACIWYSVIYLIALFRNKGTVREIQLPKPSVIAWYACWLSCLVLGCGLVFGLAPLSLVAIHLLFLAFATNLVYGVGYTLFPLLLGRKKPSDLLAVIQVVFAILGVFLMLIAFTCLLSPYTRGMFTLLGIGGTMAAIGAVVFILQWLFSKTV